jgi:multidrug resistance efflux pump
VAFPRTHRLLAVDGFGGWILRTATWVFFLAAWGAWLRFSRVAVFEVSESARLEASASVHPVDSPVSGRVSAVRVRLGDDVRVDDVLWELDSEHSRDELREAEARLRGQRDQAEALRHELGTDEALERQEIRTGEEQVREGRARYAEADAGVSLAVTEAERCQKLLGLGLTSDLDCLRLQTAARKAESAAATLRTTVSRLEAEHLAQQERARARRGRLRQELARIEGEASAVEKRLGSVRREVEERQIRAPVSGRLGWTAGHQLGSFVEEGARLGDLIPESRARAVAYFPLSALGRLRPGQPVRVRLEAFPWTQFGVLRGTVERVATEGSDGRMRAEVLLQPADASAPPVEHGLVGTAEVEVERISPLVLLVRSAGGWMGSRPRRAAS